MLDVMKRNNHMPTYEVFLDLIQASAKDPEWYEPLFFNKCSEEYFFLSCPCCIMNILDPVRKDGL